MIAEVFKPNSEFFKIYDQIKDNETSMLDAYTKTEGVWAHLMKQSFGRALRKFNDFQSFKAAYYRNLSSVLNN